MIIDPEGFFYSFFFITQGDRGAVRIDPRGYRIAVQAEGSGDPLGRPAELQPRDPDGRRILSTDIRP